MKRTKFYFLGLAVLAVFGLMTVSCGDDEETTPAPTVQINYSVDGYQVAFTALVTNANTYAWDFGDGETSTEQNPVHTYAMSGTYTVKLAVTGDGGTAEATADVEIAASKLEMLTGGKAATDGKSWQFSQQAGEGDAVLKATEGLDDIDQAIPSGMLGLIGISSEYEDEFIFHNDGSYSHVTVDDSVVVDAVYATIMQLPFRPSAEDAVGKTPFTVGKNATFTLEEGVDLTMPVTSDEYPDSTWNVTWSDVDVIEIQNADQTENEFFGLLDFTRKYMVFKISPESMQVGILISGTAGKKANYPSHIIRMTFTPKAD
jgi:PKD repeat protein